MAMTDELKQSLCCIGLQKYIPILSQSGISDWHHICHLSEAEFDAMDVKLGHRRKLQREAARRHSWPNHKALPVNVDICRMFGSWTTVENSASKG